MKMQFALSTLAAAMLWALNPVQPPALAAEQIDPQFSITSIHLEGKQVVVTAQAPPGVRRVVLESRRRLGSGTWEPAAIERFDQVTTTARTVVFRISLSADVELLRVRGDDGDILPASFYQGTNSFGNPTGAGGDAVGAGGGAGGPPVSAVPEQNRDAAPGEDKTRSVVESDIWKIDGDTLYFFNQYRGLQIIDIAKPEAPVVRGTFAMPAAGEQMYLLSPSRIVLLAHDFCGGWGPSAESQILLIDVNNGKPTLAGQISVPGSLRESRLVGTALYVVSERYQAVRLPEPKGGEVWEWGSQVSSYDLSAFAPGAAKFTAWVPGYGNAIQATDRFLFVATPQLGDNSWRGNSEVQIFDISSPDGSMQAVSKIATAGRIKDKFKMHLNGDIFVAVTERWDEVIKTQVQTFSLADPRNPQLLATLPIIEREQLHATRFSGNTLYAVTFLRIDPLWIIDLTDPANPRKVGELEIPGWSTFIQPLGDRLVTVGIDNTEGWRTSVQLFDVADPAKPTLVSKVLLGEGNSSSEANQDEKAFGVLPEQNLILVPFSSWSEQGNVQAVQLIDLEPTGLKKRGIVDHDFPARRATWHRDRILSLSGTELLGVDATNRDQPKVISRTELSWPVDRIFVQGNYLVTIGHQGQSPALRIMAANSESAVLKSLDLGKLPFLGAATANQQLFVLQGKSSEVIWPKEWNPTNYVPVSTNSASLKLTVFDLKALPEVSVIAQTEQTYDDSTRFWGQFEAVWPKPGLLVWNATGYGGWPWFRGGPVVTDAVSIAPDGGGGVSRISPIWWGGSSDAWFLGFDVSNPAAPKLTSELNLRGTNSWWNFSQPLTVNGMIYTSHESSEFDPTIQLPPHIYQSWNGKESVMVTNTPPPGAWLQRHRLTVINYADPNSPTLRKPANIPGSLIGLARDGNILYTQAYRYSDPATMSDWAERLEISAYDGVEAHLLDSMKLPQTWPHPSIVVKDSLILGRAPDGAVTSAIEVWQISDTGKFVRVNEVLTKPSPYSMSIAGGMLATQADQLLSLYDISSLPALKLLATENPSGCFGYNIKYADGSPDSGLWLPLGVYGVDFMPIKSTDP